jgi:hypothetical protein
MFEDGVVSFAFYLMLWAAWWYINKIFNFFGKSAKFDKDFKEYLLTIVHRVNSEQHKDLLYWFDEDTGEFLCQGQDVDECVRMVKEKFPTHLFYLYEHEENYLLSEGTEWKMLKIELNK